MTHATIYDIPGWPCPPSVGQIQARENSWGWIPVLLSPGIKHPVGYDEIGQLWVRADTAPRYQLCDERNEVPGAIVAWTPDGLGLWLHPRSLMALPLVTLDERQEQPDVWLPVATVLKVLPPYVTTPTVPGETGR